MVGWEDKRSLTASRLAELSKHIAAHQPREKEIYLQTPDGDEYANLIAVSAMQSLAPPVHVSTLIKVADGTPLKARTRAGGWSYVKALPEWVGTTSRMALRADMDARFQSEVAGSLSLERAARLQRLSDAARLPEQVAVIAREYRRNPDVVVEVLLRANGRCEACEASAPFLRPDGSPYLEVHHRIFLAQGGEDTVENAMAVCPNCHRRLHFGPQQEASG